MLKRGYPVLFRHAGPGAGAASVSPDPSLACATGGRASLPRLGAALAGALAFLVTTALMAAQPVNLDLRDAEIGAVIETVGRITGRNFVVDPRVKGRVSVVSPQPLTPQEVYQVFLSLLEVNGFAAVEQGPVVKIVPDVNARQSATPVFTGDSDADGATLVTRVLRVENVPAAQLVPVLRPLVPQNGHVAAYPETNMLVISDTAANVARLSRIVASIDRPTYSEAEVVKLEHASAEDVVRVLRSLGGEQQGSGPVADPRTNSVILGGDPTTRLRLRALVQHLDAPVAPTGNTMVLYLKYAEAADMVPILQGVLGEAGAAQGQSAPRGGGERTSIQAFEATNALVVTAPRDQLDSLRNIVRQLDIRRPQVMVEALIVEVSADRAKELGLQWLIDGNGDGGPIALTNFTNASTTLADVATALLNDEVPPIAGGLTAGGGDFNGKNTDFGVLLRALLTDSTTNILSTPTLMTLDNEEAEIVVGQNVPFVTGSFSQTGSDVPGVNPFQTIQREDVGLTLKIEPQINEGGAIQLTVEQEVSSISQSLGVNAADIITNKRSIKTRVLVDDGQLIVLGGLIDDQINSREQRVPILGDVPVFGHLFRYRDRDSTKRNLMVFLRPSVLRLPGDAATLTSGKYRYIREQQLQSRGKDAEVLSGADALLPPLESLRPGASVEESQSAPPGGER